MPHVLLGPGLPLLGLTLLYLSQRGLPPRFAAVFRASGPPDSGAVRRPTRTPPLIRRKRKRLFGWRRRAHEGQPRLRGGPSSRSAARVAALVFGFLAVGAAGYLIGRGQSEASLGASRTRDSGAVTASPTMLSVAATPVGTPAMAPLDRHECTAIRGSEYRSDAERSWYRGNCVHLTGVELSVWTVPTRACASGMLFTIIGTSGESVGETAAGRSFCVQDSILLSTDAFRIAGAYGCQQPLVTPSVLAVSGRDMRVDEVTCAT